MKLAFLTLDDVSFRLIAAARTPNLDALLAESTVFDRFVAAPTCSNFRAKVATGRYSFRYPGNGIGRIVKKKDKFGLDVDAGFPTLAQALAAKGKRAVQIGKWHLCALDDLEHRKRAGFKVFSGSQANLGPETYDRWTTTETHGPGNDVRNALVTEHATAWAAQAVEWAMDDAYDYIECSFNAPHKPYPTGWTQIGLLEHLDQYIGMVVLAARRYGYGLIVASDNGGTMESGYKANMKAETLNTLCAAWHLPVVSRMLVDTTDLYATVLDGVGGCASADWADGVSLFSTTPREFAFADLFPTLVGPVPGELGQEMATDGELKVVFDRDQQTVESMTWWDEPTGEDTGYLMAALDARRAS